MWYFDLGLRQSATDQSVACMRIGSFCKEEERGASRAERLSGKVLKVMRSTVMGSLPDGKLDYKGRFPGYVSFKINFISTSMTELLGSHLGNHFVG